MPVSILQACKVNVMDQDQNCSSRRCLGACFRSFRAHWYLLVVTLFRPRLRAWFRDRPDTFFKVVEILTDSRVCNKPSFVMEINGCFLWLHSSGSLKWHPEGIIFFYIIFMRSHTDFPAKNFMFRIFSSAAVYK